MTPEEARALLGPPPPTSDKSAYRAYRHQLQRYLHPDKYRAVLKANREHRTRRKAAP